MGTMNYGETMPTNYEDTIPNYWVQVSTPFSFRRPLGPGETWGIWHLSAFFISGTP